MQELTKDILKKAILNWLKENDFTWEETAHELLDERESFSDIVMQEMLNEMPLNFFIEEVISNDNTWIQAGFSHNVSGLFCNTIFDTGVELQEPDLDKFCDIIIGLENDALKVMKAITKPVTTSGPEMKTFYITEEGDNGMVLKSKINGDEPDPIKDDYLIINDYMDNIIDTINHSLIIGETARLIGIYLDCDTGKYRLRGNNEIHITRFK